MKVDPATGKTSPTLVKPFDNLVAGAAFNPATGNIECKNVTDIHGVKHANVACKSLSAGDGHVIMGDGHDIYIFGFHDVTSTPVDQILNMINDVQVPPKPGGMRGAEASAPTINAQAGQEFYLNLTNHTMFERPDLADPHTVHNHGFPNAANVFDGEPMASIAVNMGETLSYYYNFVEPGTYMFHCHVEAAEHMQMGMLGNLNVRPQQDLGVLPPNNTAITLPVTYNGKPYSKFAYNDCATYVNNSPVPANGCGSTGYNVSYPLEVTAFDPDFHHSDNTYNDIDFAAMRDAYHMFNGRGYPYTINPCSGGRQTPYPAFPSNYPACAHPEQLYDSVLSVPTGCGGLNSDGTPFGGACTTHVQSQNVSALITARVGDKILLHVPSLSTSDFSTITLLGLPMQLVGQGARQYRGPTGLTYYKKTNSITFGGGEGFDILIDTTGAKAGTYFMYSTNLNQLSNNDQDYGGAMTEIVIN
jgi:FtsP/CotA-like multicopper oxidase with cupredoxin domain